MQSNQSLLSVIGGPNGSGKTTLTHYLIAKKRVEPDIINPDEIAFKEFGSYSFQMQAARTALERRRSSLSLQKDFTFESTFSGKSEINDIKEAKRLGYKVVLYYVALQSVIDNVTRVEERQTMLGHDVKSDDIIRRYTNSQQNLIKYIALFDKAYLFDNSGLSRSRVAIFSNGKLAWINKKHQHHPFFEPLFSGNLH